MRSLSLSRSVVAALALVFALAAAPVAQTNVLDVAGTTVGAPTTALPLFGSTPEACSLAPDAEPYDPTPFSVDTDGAYAVSVVEPVSTIADTDDTVLLVYEGSFDPADACAAFVGVGNETAGSGLTVPLVAGDYVLVVAGFLGTEDAFTVRITGPEGSTITTTGPVVAVDLVVTSFTDPVQRGGTLDVFATAENTTDTSVLVRAVLEIEAPGGAMRTYRGRKASVPAGALVGPGQAIQVNVPQNAPFGTYEAALVLTDEGTGEELDREAFTFSVVVGTPTIVATREDADNPWIASPETGAPEAFSPETASPEASTVVAAPEALSLLAPSPNPARGAVTLRYEVPASGEVTLVVYDALGREVAVAASGEHAPGRYTAGLTLGPLAPGVYVARLTAGSEAAVRRFTVVR